MKFMYKKSKYDFTYCTISTVSSRILKICWPRWPINFLLSSSDLKQGLFFWPLRVTELTVEMVHVGIDYRSEYSKYFEGLRQDIRRFYIHRGVAWMLFLIQC